MHENVIAIAIFIVVIASVALDKIHKATIAILGMVMLFITRIFTVQEAIEHVDFNTIGVLLGMMLFVGVVKQSGLFEYIAIKTAKLAGGNPVKILVFFIAITAFLSAFLDNVTTVLLIGPMTITIAKLLSINPVPLLINQILASNIGGTATLIGDPPNIMIGSAANLGFIDFLRNTAPVAIITMVILMYIMKTNYSEKLKASDEAISKMMQLDETKAITDHSLLLKSSIMIPIVTIAFILHDLIHIDTATIALSAAGIMLLIGKQDVNDVIEGVEWPTLIFFIGLFVIVGGLEKTGVIHSIAIFLLSTTHGHPISTMLILLWASALLSAILDNIPFVATLIPLIGAMEATGVDVAPLWWAISLGACLGGNGTLIGASANVVLSSISNKNGFPITFKSYLRFGLPVMLLSVLIASAYLVLRYAKFY